MIFHKFKKFTKTHKLHNRGVSKNGNCLSFGTFGMKAITKSRINSNQIESARKVISKYIKKEGKLWIRIYPDKSITKKPIDVRMGNGKGNIYQYIYNVKPGRILYEVSGVTENTAKKIFKLASFKLPVKTIFINF